MFKLTATLVLLSLALSTLAQQDTCYGLVLQGGGDKGAYQAGAFSVLSSVAGGQYDIVSGVSFGGLNAAFISQYAKGQEATASNDLINFWFNLKASDLYQNWAGGIVQGALYEAGLYNTAPSQDFLNQNIKTDPQRYVSVGATNVDNATYLLFENFHKNLAAADLAQGVQASMALAGLFPYVVINDTAYFDGGAIISVDVGSAIAKCRELVNNDDSKIYIDVVLLTNKVLSEKNVTDFNGVQMLLRTLELMSYNTATKGLVQAHDTYPNINWRHLVQPQSPLPSSVLPASFPHDEIVDMIALGKQDAQAAINAGAGVTFEEFVKEARTRIGRASYRKEEEILVEAFGKQFENIRAESERNPEYGADIINV